MFGNEQKHRTNAETGHRPVRRKVSRSWYKVVVKIVGPESRWYSSQSNSNTKWFFFFPAVLKVTYSHRRNNILQGAPQIMRRGLKQNIASRFLLRPLLIPGQFVWGLWCKKWQALGQGFHYMLRHGRSWFRNIIRARDFSLPHNVQTASGAHTTSYSACTGILFPEHIGRGLKLSIHLHPVPRLRISEAIPQLPLYDFMVWTGKPLPFTFLLLLRLSPVSGIPPVVSITVVPKYHRRYVI